MSNYPKMLYKGDKVEYEYQTASNEESEKELLDSGWVSFSDLPEPKIESKPNGVIGTNKLQSLEKENIKLKEELVEALNENQELRKQIRFKQVEDMLADELRKLLDERKVEYGARDGKPVLINLVLESEDQS
ncbi:MULTISPECIES: hypothetical protein [Acinetobacter]|uniref:Uncharacterized protein n=1 Tax=Acinetobacter junii TaxID=40215 RepID=A0A365PM69_ACIJU|nr:MULTISPECIES: hypothetical protein [Acinetobacter]RBA42335.1 hypothetical protein DDF86_00275 [Acinetobacter junii]RBA42905.1 hypothetical protein DDG62_01520 [Acinetobacter junii]RBA49810.1 hypothetical protein DC346_01900 [Acinetobacter junii]WLF73474.1 hypothetical protein Q4617_05545 [Acinetobacter junii]